jgi:hypothetical protein
MSNSIILSLSLSSLFPRASCSIPAISNPSSFLIDSSSILFSIFWLSMLHYISLCILLSPSIIAQALLTPALHHAISSTSFTTTLATDRPWISSTIFDTSPLTIVLSIALACSKLSSWFCSLAVIFILNQSDTLVFSFAITTLGPILEDQLS